MNDMREIVTVAQVEGLFRVLAVGGPLLGAMVGILMGRTRRSVGRYGLAGACIGLLASLNYGAWRLYLAISERLGMDTVANLLVNLGLFVAVGCVGGVLYGRWHGRSQAVSQAAGAVGQSEEVKGD